MNTAVCHLSSEQPLQVLNVRLSERLTAVNAAHRRLSALGYHIDHQALRVGSNKRPLLYIVNGDAKLQTLMTNVGTAMCDEGVTTMGQFGDVDLCWLIARRSA